MPGTETQINKTALIRFIVLLALVILVASGFFWWRNVRMSANNVFWGMISNSLSTASVTRRITQSSADKSLDQYIREQFGAINASESTVTITQTDKVGKSIVKSETIGTPQNDYSRYTSISTLQKTAKGQPINAADVIGLWGKSPDAKKGQPVAAHYFQQSVLTVIPFGNFNQKQKRTLINQMHDRDIYNFSAGAVKSGNQNGRPVFIYQVKIASAAYVDLMRTYVSYLGLGDIGLDPSQYVGSPPLSAEITVDKLSRQLVKIDYPETKQSVAFVDQNLDQPISLPQTTIPISDLQNRIQKVIQ